MGCLIFVAILAILGTISIYIGLDDSDIWLTIIGVLFVLPSILAIIGIILGNTEKSKKEQKQYKQNLEDKINNKFKEENVEITQQYRSVNHSVIGIDENRKKVCFLNSDADFNFHNFNVYGAITDQIKYTARTFDYRDILESQVIFDGETVTKNKVQKIQLEITVNDLENPIQTVTFLDEAAPISKKSDKFKKAYEKATHWHNIFKVIIKQG